MEGSDDDGQGPRGKRKGKLSKGSRKEQLRHAREAQAREIQELDALLQAQMPPETLTLDDLKLRQPAEFFAAASQFAELPLCGFTKRALADANFVRQTVIQRLTIPHALVGRNVVGLAKTGSGKTLAFLIPLVERLYHGLGAIVVSPTRELAMQTFEVLKVLTKYHSFSGGLMIGGGMDVDVEREAVAGYNIVVCTPGRLLQQLDESYHFRCDNLKMLVFDECDRLLDMGFQPTIDSILQHLPVIKAKSTDEGLQCLMFSATGTKVLVSQRIVATDFVEVDSAHGATPKALRHMVMRIPLHHKMRTLWSFIKQHTKTKMIVFVSSCKEARLLEEVFRRMGPGMWLSTIHGRISQAKRMEIYYQFREALFACLIATDVAARGLDFIGVDWVVQMDCPEDVDSYVHRAGRTARLGDKGNALLFLMPSEEAFLPKLQAKGMALEEVFPDESKIRDPTAELEALVARDAELKFVAQKAFISYMRSVYLAADKEVFDVTALPYKEYAKSLGLLSVPKIKFGKSAVRKKNLPYSTLQAMQLQQKHDDHGDDGDDGAADGEQEDRFVPVPAPKTTKMERLLHRKPVAGKLSKAREKLRAEDDGDSAGGGGGGDDGGDDELLVAKRVDHELEDQGDVAALVPVKRFKVDTVQGTEWVQQGAQYGQHIKGAMKREDAADKMNAKQRRRERLKLEKQQRKAKKAAQTESAELAPPPKEDAVPKSLADREALALALLDQ